MNTRNIMQKTVSMRNDSKCTEIRSYVKINRMVNESDQPIQTGNECTCNASSKARKLRAWGFLREEITSAYHLSSIDTLVPHHLSHRGDT